MNKHRRGHLCGIGSKGCKASVYIESCASFGALLPTTYQSFGKVRVIAGFLLVTDWYKSALQSLISPSKKSR